MRFGSVCSGIEAASVAWHQLGWKAAWLAEIETFPSAALAHHYPKVPNYGDMTKLPARIASGEIEAPDVFCGGTPCQAFSVAGKRESLADARGNLSLTFCTIADAIDAARHIRGLPASIVFWENVPGALSTKDNFFGCFIAQLCGGDEPLNAPDGWPDAGCVSGPSRTAAWRVLDAQYFGLAQRRKRVFVVASARNDFDPAAVLFEWDGLRRDFAPSRESREEITGTLSARTQGGGGLGTDFDIAGGVQPVAGTLGANHGNIKAEHAWTGQLLPVVGTLCVATGQGGAEIGAEIAPTLNCNHEAPYIAKPTFAAAFKGGQGSAAGSIGYSEHVAPTLSSADSGSNRTPVVLTHAQHVPCIAFPERLSGTQCASTADLSPSLGALNPMAIAFTTEQTPKFNPECALTLTKQSPMGGGQIQSVAYTTKLHNTKSNNAGKIFEERTVALDANSPPPALLTAMQVRRLTPRECERLQGFPDDYTMIPGKRKNIRPEKLDHDYIKYLARGGVMSFEQCCNVAADGPRYKALGNSWAIPCITWIGRRIDAAVKALA